MTYHEKAENMPTTQKSEGAPQARKKIGAKNTPVHARRKVGNLNHKVILDILTFRQYEVSWQGGFSQI